MVTSRTIKIFLGSSIIELANERQDISLLTNDISTLFKLDNVDVRFVLCENINVEENEKWGHESQHIVDEQLRECDVSLFLFKSKAGKWTRHEYDVASALQKEGRHRFFVYFLHVYGEEKDASIKDFQMRLRTDGVSWTECDTLSDAKYKFAVDLMNHLGVTLSSQSETEYIEKTGDNLLEKYTSSRQHKPQLRTRLHKQIEVLLTQISTLKESPNFVIAMVVQVVKMYKKADCWAEKSGYDKEKYYNLLSDYAGFLHDYALYYDSEIINVRAIALAEELYGTEHENTAIAYNRIGMVYYSQDEYEKALGYFGRALKIRERKPDLYYPEIATTYNNIGGVYRKQGKYRMALELYDKALEIQKENLNSNRLRMADTYNNKGVSFRYESLFEESLDCHLMALEIREDVLGTNHPDTAISYSNIGTTYRYLGNYDKALEYYQKALNADITTRGINNDYTAIDYHNLGSVYRLLGNSEEALKYYHTALAIEEKILDTNHPDIGTEYNNIGLLYSDMGNYSKALEYYGKALKVYQATLDKNHPSMATLYNNVGVACLEQGDSIKALEYLYKALGIKKEIYDENNTILANTYHYLGGLYYQEKDYEKAMEYLGQAYAIRQAKLGQDHPETQETQKWIDEIKKVMKKETTERKKLEGLRTRH